MKVILYIIIFPYVIFTQNKDKDMVRFLAAGDLNIAHWITPLIDRKGPDFPFLNLKNIMHNSHLVFANLEAPFCEEGVPFPKNFVFKVPEKHVNVLKAGNINLVSLANNHILDYGYDCLSNTINILNKENINYAGAGENFSAAFKPALFDINNISFAFFAYSMTLPKYFFASDTTGGTAYPYKNILRDSISFYNNKVDFIIVSFHWGEELTEIPKDYQIKVAHNTIDYGADIVLGHHPHVLQGIEVYKSRPIFYSLGNFIFASYSKKSADSIIIDFVLKKSKIEKIKILPLNVNNYEVNFIPKLLTAKRKIQVLEKIQMTSRKLNQNKEIISSDGTIRLN